MQPATPPRALRYDGIDNFRPFAALGIIVLYLAAMTDAKAELGGALRLRDCALPFFVMAAFFLQTRAAMRGPGKGYGDFLRKRMLRIGAPFLAWTAIYILLFDVLPAWRHGAPAQVPAASMLLTGHSQLWFLSFVLLAAAGLFPLVRLVARRGAGSWPLATACVGLPVVWAVFAQSWATRVFEAAVADGWDEPVIHYLDAGATYLPYSFAGIGLALSAEPTAAAYRSVAVRAAVLVGLVLAATLHVQTGEVWTRAAFSLLVFLAALQPWPSGLTRVLRPVAAQSFSIYIVFKPIMVAFLSVLARLGLALTPAAIPPAAALVLAITWAAVLVGRRVLPDWLLPPNEVAPAPAPVPAPATPGSLPTPQVRLQPG